MISLLELERTECATSPAVSGYTGQGDARAGLWACPGIPTTKVAGWGGEVVTERQIKWGVSDTPQRRGIRANSNESSLK